MAAAAGRTLVLPSEPVHHVTGVTSVTAAQTEVGGASDSHVTDGTLEGEAFTDRTLSPSSLAATVTAVHTELCRGDRGGGSQHVDEQRCFCPAGTTIRQLIITTCCSLYKLSHLCDDVAVPQLLDCSV